MKADVLIAEARRAWRNWYEHLEQCVVCGVGGDASCCAQGDALWARLSNATGDLMRHREDEGDV